MDSYALHKLRLTTAPRPDGIRARMLIELSNDIGPILATILNETMTSGILPDQWKLSNIAPIFRKYNPSDAGKYREVAMDDLMLKSGENWAKKLL